MLSLHFWCSYGIWEEIGLWELRLSGVIRWKAETIYETFAISWSSNLGNISSVFDCTLSAGCLSISNLNLKPIPNRRAHIILNPKPERARHLLEPQSPLSIAVNNSIREIYVNFLEHNFDTHQIMHAMRRDPIGSKRNQADLATPTRPDQLAWLRHRLHSSATSASASTAHNRPRRAQINHYPSSP